MKLEYLPFLFEINRFHSISSAARSLRIHQTTLSSIVKNIEDELGYLIFQRSPNGVTLSPRGELFMNYAEEMYSRYQEMIQLAPNANMDTSKVTCLMSSMLMSRVALPITQLFSSRQPHSSIVFRETITSNIIRQIENEDAKVGLTFITKQEYLTQKRQNLLNIHLLAKDRFVLLVSPNHPLAGKISIRSTELCGENIATTKRMTNNLVLNNIAASPNHVTVISDVDLVLDAVQNMNMIAFVPTLLLPKYREQNFVTIELLDTPEENLLYLCMLTAKNTCMSNQELALISCFQDYFHPYTQALMPDHLKGPTPCESTT